MIEIQSKPTTYEREFTTKSGAKFIIKDFFKRDGATLQDILVRHMLIETDRHRPKAV